MERDDFNLNIYNKNKIYTITSLDIEIKMKKIIGKVQQYERDYPRYRDYRA